MSASSTRIERAYELACEEFADVGVNVDSALELVSQTPISLHCWQADDVTGFENRGAELGGGLAVTGAYPGKPRTPDELRADVELALQLIPGPKRFNLHASYADYDGSRVDRDALEPKHFWRWIDWAKEKKLGLDFNPTFFAHPLAEQGTLSSLDSGVQKFWIDHAKVCRKIAAAMGEELRSPCICNIWIPDGSKDEPALRYHPRELLRIALDEVFAEPILDCNMRDCVEPKLFGLGSEAYVVGSYDFYLAYAVATKKMLCLDTGHFHPTESVADKLSAVSMFLTGIMLHVSRGLRWDSDHVVMLTDETRAVVGEALCAPEKHGDVRIGLDYFDASINRIAAYAIGARAVQQAMLASFLAPEQKLNFAQFDGDFTARLAWQARAKTLPYGAVWEYYCLQQDVPTGMDWLDVVRDYERRVFSGRT